MDSLNLESQNQAKNSFPTNDKRQNGWFSWGFNFYQAQFFGGTSNDHREGLWMVRIEKNCIKRNRIFIPRKKIDRRATIKS